ncbi:PREDICTED: PNMA-like protein 1-like [Elephantulus edwardii]|uniref:PNMA-like protein 1-like n=1 Tax=Elephantulus edwardii TaxID=28737 RepID=UPI0003F07969|nr:PREDICTED: PNMA-like protein 1-like [Elephantulus edwardii]
MYQPGGVTEPRMFRPRTRGSVAVETAAAAARGEGSRRSACAGARCDAGGDSVELEASGRQLAGGVCLHLQRRSDRGRCLPRDHSPVASPRPGCAVGGLILLHPRHERHPARDLPLGTSAVQAHLLDSQLQEGSAPRVLPTPLSMAAMNLLEDWCRGMDMDIHRALLVVGIPVECDQAEIEETLRGVFTPLGPYHVLNKIFVRAENTKAALVEVGEGVNLSTVPREFPGRGGSWRVVCRDPTQDAEFLRNLHEFLEVEGRTMEDVIRLLHPNRPSRPLSRNVRHENWAEALGALLGAVVQMLYHMDAELRSREEARAQELVVAEAVAACTSEGGRQIKKEPGPASKASCILKLEEGSRGDLIDEAPQPLARRSGPKNASKRKKQNTASKQERRFWKKPSSEVFYEDSDGDEADKLETSTPKPSVKQEEADLKKSRVKYARRVRRPRPQETSSSSSSSSSSSEEENLGGTSESGQEVPPKKKAMGLGSRKRLAPMRKKKKLSLGPVSGDPMDVEDAVKLPESPKKEPETPGSPGDLSGETLASGSSGPEVMTEGSSQTSSDKNDQNGHLEGGKRWEAEDESPKGEGEALCETGGKEGSIASEEATDAVVEGVGGNPTLPPSPSSSS